MTDPSQGEAKLRELISRLEILIGDKASEQSYKEVTQQNVNHNMQQLKVGDRVERVRRPARAARGAQRQALLYL